MEIQDTSDGSMIETSVLDPDTKDPKFFGHP
jgi:hypothetical protein